MNLQDNFYRQQTSLINLEEINKNLFSDSEEKNAKILKLNNIIEQLKDSYSELESEQKTTLEMYNKLLELEHEKELNDQHNSSVNFQQSENDQELYEKQIHQLEGELVYYKDLLGC